MGLNGHVRRKKPLLRTGHVEKQRKFANAFKHWGGKWHPMLWFSDESKFNLIGSDGRQYCRRRPGEEYLPRNVTQVVAHGGGSVMVWGVVSWRGTRQLYHIIGNLNGAGYVRILNKMLLPSLEDAWVRVENMTFIQDNTPMHTSVAAKSWFAENGMEMLPWPPNSPDLNIIENIWEALDRHMRKRCPLPWNIDQLWQYLEEEWDLIDIDTICTLYDSIPHCMKAVEKAEGLWTKY